MDAPPTSRAQRRRTVVILGALTGFAPLSVDMYLPGLPEMEHSLHASASEVQLTLTAFFFGLAIGQLVVGPLSDRFGRRRPLMVGVSCYIAASLLCAAAPSVLPLVGFRLLQAIAGAAGIVIAQATVRDLHSGAAAARFYAALMLVNGVAPIVAPVIGGLLLHVTTWRGIFVVLAGLGAAMLAAVVFGLSETLPPERRHAGGMRQTATVLRGLFRDRTFMGIALAGAFMGGTLFAYISASPFVLENIFGVSPQVFSLIFAANAVGIVVVGQFTGRWLVKRYPLRTILSGALAVTLTAGLVLLVVALIGDPPLWAVLPVFFAVPSMVGAVNTTVPVLALADHPEAAGSAAGILGVLAFLMGGIASPLVGLAGDSIVPVAVTIFSFAVLANLSARVLAQPRAAV